jgi:hypothetical protein
MNGLPNSVLRNSEAFQVASNSAQFYGDRILQLSKQNEKYFNELKGIQGDIDALLAGGTFEIEEKTQRKLNKEKFRELTLRKEIKELKEKPFTPTAPGEMSISAQIAARERELELSTENQQNIRDEADFLRQEKIVALDEYNAKLEEGGKSQQEFVAKDIEDFKKKLSNLDTEIERMSDINLLISENSKAMAKDEAVLANTLEIQKGITKELRKQVEYAREMLGGPNMSVEELELD